MALVGVVMWCLLEQNLLTVLIKLLCIFNTNPIQYSHLFYIRTCVLIITHLGIIMVSRKIPFIFLSFLSALFLFSNLFPLLLVLAIMCVCVHFMHLCAFPFVSVAWLDGWLDGSSMAV